jgi:hypothetical protein
MKKIIALALVLNATTAFAFFADDAASNAAGMGQGRADVQGNGNAEGEANFSMSFTARGKTAGDFNGNGDFNSNVNGYGVQSRDVYRPPYYGTRNYAFPVEPEAGN